MHALDGDAAVEFFQLVLADIAEGTGAIGALDAVFRQFHLALELAVGGHQQQTLGVHVEPADWHDPFHVLGEHVVDRLLAGKVAFGGQIAVGLVEAEQLGGGRFGDGIAVDGDAGQIFQQQRGMFDGVAIECDPPGFDHPLDLAARGDAGAGQQFGDALAFAAITGGCLGHGGGFRTGGRFCAIDLGWFFFGHGPVPWRKNSGAAICNLWLCAPEPLVSPWWS